jgi:hypothetical protein
MKLRLRQKGGFADSPSVVKVDLKGGGGLETAPILSYFYE